MYAMFKLCTIHLLVVSCRSLASALEQLNAGAAITPTYPLLSVEAMRTVCRRESCQVGYHVCEDQNSRTRVHDILNVGTKDNR